MGGRLAQAIAETSQSISMEPGDRLSWRCLVLRIYGDPEGSYRVGLFPRLVYGRFPPLVLEFCRNFQMVLQALDRAVAKTQAEQNQLFPWEEEESETANLTSI